MVKHKKRSGQARLPTLAVMALIALCLLMILLLRGADVTLFNPKGLIAQEQAHLMIFVSAILLIIAIPTLTLFYFFAWKYRESNDHATYDATIRHGKLFTLGLWAIPSFVVLILTLNMWPAAHELDPHRAITAAAEPLTIQVIAMRWKWLFIYPEHNIASLNFVQVPLNTPIKFELTADEAPMNSFWIPHWGGQLYAMTGHDNRLNLLASNAGDYSGRAAEINGDGFADMKFIARASSEKDFNHWVHAVQESSIVLDSRNYGLLLRPSENSRIAFYSSPQTGLYNSVLTKYGGSHNHSGY